MKVVKVTLATDPLGLIFFGNSVGACYVTPVDDIGCLADDIKDGQHGDKYMIEIMEMDDAEFMRLQDFEGF